MSNTVEVIRYLRPFLFEHYYGINNNLYGITIIYTINYEEKNVKASWSICNEDNFDKAVGKEIARNSKTYVNFDLEMVNQESGLTNALILELMKITNEFFWPQDFGEQLHLFLKATRKLNK